MTPSGTTAQALKMRNNRRSMGRESGEHVSRGVSRGEQEDFRNQDRRNKSKQRSKKLGSAHQVVGDSYSRSMRDDTEKTSTIQQRRYTAHGS
jgi:hypothetical protein